MLVLRDQRLGKVMLRADGEVAERRIIPNACNSAHAPAARPTLRDSVPSRSSRAALFLCALRIQPHKLIACIGNGIYAAAHRNSELREPQHNVRYLRNVKPHR